MLDVGGQLFILEGERPPALSASEEELRGVMREFGTLESPFDPAYLRALLDENGLAVVGDYVSVNGLFERALLEGDRLPLTKVATDYHYLICKKVAAGARASTVPDSRRPGTLSAHIAPLDALPETVRARRDRSKRASPSPTRATRSGSRASRCAPASSCPPSESTTRAAMSPSNATAPCSRAPSPPARPSRSASSATRRRAPARTL